MRRSGLPGGAWVVVAEERRRFFLTNVGDMEDMNLVVRKKEEHGEPADRRMGHRPPGPVQRRADATAFCGAGNRLAMKLEKQRFASDLCGNALCRGAPERLQAPRAESPVRRF